MSNVDESELKLSDVPVFNKVAATLSFKRASEMLRQSRSVVSKCMGRLESVHAPYLSRSDYEEFAIYPTRKPPASVRVFVEFVEN